MSGVMNFASDGVFILKVMWDSGSFQLKCRNQEILDRWQTILDQLIKKRDEGRRQHVTSVLRNATFIDEDDQVPALNSRSSSSGAASRNHKSMQPAPSQPLAIDRKQRRSDGNVNVEPFRGHPMRNQSLSSVGSYPPPPPAQVGAMSPPTSAKPTGKIKIKIHYQDDMYQIAVPNDTDYDTLRGKIEKKIVMCAKMPDNGWDGLRIKYMDEDGDLIMITGDEDVGDSFEGRDSSNPMSTLNLYVTEVQQ
jgi:hypothetical protein